MVGEYRHGWSWIYIVLFATYFCGICRRQLKIEKKGKVFCAKPKEVDPINLNFCMKNKFFDSTQK